MAIDTTSPLTGAFGVERSLEGIRRPLALILFACALATRSAIPGPLARASHPDRWSAGCAWERGRQAGVSSHDARIARSNAVPRIERVPCPLRLVCLCYRGQCVASGACNACHDAGNARPGAAASVGACSRLGASELTAHARVSLACLCMRADFVRPANRVIKHKVLCVCVFGPCFLYALIYFCSRGAMLVGTNKHHPVSPREFLHARTCTHWVTSACDLFPW